MLLWINFWITMSWTDLNPQTQNAEDLDLKSFRFRLQTSDFRLSWGALSEGLPLQTSDFRLSWGVFSEGLPHQTSGFPGESFLKGSRFKLQTFLGNLV